MPPDPSEPMLVLGKRWDPQSFGVRLQLLGQLELTIMKFLCKQGWGTTALSDGI